MSNLRAALTKVLERKPLAAGEAAAAFGEILDGDAPSSVVAAFLVALRMRGEGAEELAGAAEAMLARAVPLDLGDDALLDTAGTGGDGAGTFNISTGAALVAAAAGVKVAKHGNRAASGAVGAADVLEQFGVRIDLDPPGLRRCLQRANFCFVFAQKYHPVMAKVAPVRRELGVRTLFNLLGPLANPARPAAQLLGVAEAQLMAPMAEAALRLGTSRAMVVHGRDGLDEISLAAPTAVLELREGRIDAYEITPEALSVARSTGNSQLKVPPQDAVNYLRAALSGDSTHQPAQDVLALNAGAAIFVAGKAVSLADGVMIAREVLRSGRALHTIDLLRQTTQEAA